MIVFEQALSNVSDNLWSSSAVKRLAEKDIISGYSNGSFRPDKTVNRAEVLTANVQGSSDFKAQNLKAKTVSLIIGGASDAVVYATESLTVNASGTANVDYLGNPQTKNITATDAAEVSGT
mgnify:CR=1 FL=1